MKKNDLKITEKDDAEGTKMTEKLRKEFDSNYRQFASASDLHD